MQIPSQKSDILVSVIIPTYNHAHLIKKALNSLIEQTHPHWEAIVINNYSADNTLEVIASYNDARIRVVNFHNNGSIAASRNVGIREAKAEYIAFLDSDDYWYAQKIEKCLSRLLADKADVCVNSEMMVSNEKDLGPIQCGTKEQLTYFNLLFRNNLISTSSVLMKKSCIDVVGNFNEDSTMITAEDYDLWLRIANAGFKFTAVDEILGGHLLHSSNSSSYVEKHHNAIKTVLDIHFKNFPDNVRINLNRRIRYANLFYGTGRNATRQKKYDDSLKFFKEAFKYNPFKVKTYPAACISLVKKMGLKS
jgi:teichuronic acid biosynthesis glycosyltransferase TuaG